ncbi:hypothetical protein AeMF1_012437 [Aphanomyces euteiches]|nr:hypothetical protein AeMF1_012437 [Aphanomyces euteiches]KAH9191728.1 hypothetical protein AeNC1_006301 [Aphanomyces euteiches]
MKRRAEDGSRMDDDCGKRQRFTSPAMKDSRREKDETHRMSPPRDKRPPPKSQMQQKETDPHKLAQRQKQIDFGKNTIGYDRYIQEVPKHQRKPGIHPSTPDKHAVASKRAWDGRVQAWRRHLHKYDPQPATPQPSSQEAAKKEDPVPVVVTPPQHEPSSSMGSAKGSIFDDFEEDTKPSAEIDEDDLL